MKIKINNKKVKIKPFVNLTVKEYIKFWKLYDEAFKKYNGEISHIRYIIIFLTAITKYEYSDLLNETFQDKHLIRLISYIGRPVTIDKIQYKNHFWYIEDGLMLHKFQNWQSTGTRLMMEQRIKHTDNVIELTTYMLAIAIQNEYNNEKTNEIYKKLLNYNAFDVIGFTYFFFRNLQNGLSSGSKFLLRLRKALSINIQQK